MDVILYSKIQNKVDSSLMKKCILHTVTTDNLFDKSTAETGYVSKDGTAHTSSSYTKYKYSAKIPVNPGDVLRFYNKLYSSVTAQNAMVVAAFNASDTAVEGSGAESVNTYTVPAGIKSVIVTFNDSLGAIDTFMAIKNNPTKPSAYIPYGVLDQYYIATEDFLPKENFILNIPKKIYAFPNEEMNIWFDNIVDGHDTDYEFDVTCSVGMQLERGFRVNTSDEGSYPITITAVRKKDGSTVTKESTIIVADEDAGNGVTRSIIVLGDSTTASGTAMAKLHSNFENDVMAVTTNGTQGTSPNNHEGRMGWKFYNYFSSGVGGVTNPFYNPSTQTFDAGYYFTNSLIAEPDYFIINLGINDCFGATTDAEAQTVIDSVIEYCDDMIESVKTASASIKAVVCLTIPPNYSQDAFGKDYSNGQTRHRYKRNNALLVQKLIEEYDNRENEGIYICPIHVALDVKYNMQLETIPVNARNPDITYSSPVGNAGVHPDAKGYWQIADMYKAFLKAHEE